VFGCHLSPAYSSGLLMAGFLSTLMISCGGAHPSAPDPNARRPPVDQNGFVRHTETIVVRVPMEALTKWRQSVSLESILHGTKRIPGVDHTVMIHGVWDETGARRRVFLTDGNTTTEEVLVNQRPALFRYEVWGFTNWARFLIDYAVGEFQFHEVPGGTQVQWTYSFHKRSWLMTPMVSWVVQNDFAEFMRSALQTMQEAAEQDCRRT
jgi:Polyketide cyclase / dehydrase and lipid transport